MGIAGNAGQTNYSASKAGIIGGSILIFIGFEIFFSNFDLVVESIKLIFMRNILNVLKVMMLKKMYTFMLWIHYL